jgi:hypothetical protein
MMPCRGESKKQSQGRPGEEKKRNKKTITHTHTKRERQRQKEKDGREERGGVCISLETNITTHASEPFCVCVCMCVFLLMGVMHGGWLMIGSGGIRENGRRERGRGGTILQAIVTTMLHTRLYF